MNKIFKKTVSLLITLMMLLGAVSASALALDINTLAYDFKVNEYGNATLVKVTNAFILESDVVVPSVATIDGVKYTVQGIGSAAFLNCDRVTSITIPEGVTTIGSRAFAGCTSLTTVSIPKTLARCEYDAFDGCGRVTVNCYKANYQFFTVYGLNSNIDINVLDGNSSSSDANIKVTNIIEMIKAIIYKILSIFKISFSGSTVA